MQKWHSLNEQQDVCCNLYDDLQAHHRCNKTRSAIRQLMNCRHTLVSDFEAPKNETELDVRKPVNNCMKARMVVVWHMCTQRDSARLDLAWFLSVHTYNPCCDPGGIASKNIIYIQTIRRLTICHVKPAVSDPCCCTHLVLIIRHAQLANTKRCQKPCVHVQVWTAFFTSSEQQGE